jgi:predicted DsbA family dithiol-disulfide isomerase
VLASRLQSQEHRQRVMQARQTAMSIGVSSVPTVLVNGRFIASQSRTVECLGEFIADARENATSGE